MSLRGIALRVKPQGSRGYPRKGTGEPSPGSWVEGASLPMGHCALLAQLAQQSLGLEGEGVSAHTWGGCGSFSPQEARVNSSLKPPTHTLPEQILCTELLLGERGEHRIQDSAEKSRRG